MGKLPSVRHRSPPDAVPPHRPKRRRPLNHPLVRNPQPSPSPPSSFILQPSTFTLRKDLHRMDLYRDLLKQNDPEIFATLAGEEARQAAGIELIPSENYTYPEVLAALGSVFTNKYSEGYPGRRYYGGQEFTDQMERIAIDRAKKLFRAEHANVQALSGSPMNQAAYLGLLEPGDTILAMDLSHGGHLTHGAPVSHMGRI